MDNTEVYTTRSNVWRKIKMRWSFGEVTSLAPRMRKIVDTSPSLDADNKEGSKKAKAKVPKPGS